MKIFMAQINTTVGDVHGNRDRVLAELAEAERLGADLAVFPELCLTGYPPRDLLGLNGFVDANLGALRQIAAATVRVAAVVGFVDRNRDKEGKEFYNAAAFLEGGRVADVIHKTLLPTYDVFDEDRYFEPAGSTRVVPFRDRKLGLSICEDAWNDPEFWTKPLYRSDPIRDLAAGGANLLINISASPFELDKPAFRFRMLRNHARKHRIPLLYLNLVGGNDELVFDGNSLALGRNGEVLARGPSFAESVFVVDTDSGVDLGCSEEPEIESLYKALVLGTRDYARKCGFRSAVLGLSGGIDSAVTGCLAAEALGPRHVLGVAMPSGFSAPESLADARALAENLGIDFMVIPIESVFDAYRKTLEPAFRNRPADTTEENLQARIRGNLLMALSNKFGHLVLSTGNKSELGVGYCTLYGDMAGGLAVISDVPKTQVYRLADFINREREIIPGNTIARAPTAELRANQKDQDSLPEYGLLDDVLRLVVEEELGIEEITERGFPRQVVEDVFARVEKNEYKRRQAAPGLKVTSRAFGTGRRMPIAKRLSF